MFGRGNKAEVRALEARFQEKIEDLEREIKRLRRALEDADERATKLESRFRSLAGAVYRRRRDDETTEDDKDDDEDEPNDEGNLIRRAKNLGLL